MNNVAQDSASVFNIADIYKNKNLFKVCWLSKSIVLYYNVYYL